MKIKSLLTISSASLLLSCGGSSGGGVDSWYSTFAEGLAVSSPTASTSSSLSVRLGKYKRLFMAETPAEIDPDASLEAKAEILADLASGTASGCMIKIPQLRTLGQSANCYGPAVAYTDHPDCTGGGCTADGDTADADGSSAADTDGDDSLPTGDLGIWNAAESGEACAAAQMNSLMGASASYIDAALMMQAGSICLLKEAGTDLPEVGDTVTFTDEFADAISMDAATVTMEQASVKRTGENTFQYEFEGSLGTGKDFSIIITHESTESDNSEYKGQIKGYFSQVNREIFSVTYAKDATDLKVRAQAGNYSTSIDPFDAMDTDGNLDMGGNFQGNMNHAIINHNFESENTNLSYAWQAGANDSNTRVFNVYVNGNGDSADTGCGYFGYGAEFSSSIAANTNTIDGFICNWAGPGNNHTTSLTTHANKAQKQCFTRDGTGKFVESGTSKLTYWPSNSCNKSGAFALSPYPDYNSGGSTTSNDLVANITTDTEFLLYEAPTAPTL